jgi:transcriptional regulator with XRE-family HTH domain
VDDYEDQAQKIRERAIGAREGAGLSIGQAARILDIERSWIEAWESGSDGRMPIHRLADVYGTSLKWLVLGVPSEISDENLRLLGRVPERDRTTLRQFMERAPTEEVLGCECGRSASCIGQYDEMVAPLPSCDECCGCGNENGWCEAIEGAWDCGSTLRKGRGGCA